jgi:hypothetical protein
MKKMCLIAFNFQSIFKDNQKNNVILSSLSVKTLLTLLAEAAGQDVNSLTRQVRGKLVNWFRKTLKEFGWFCEA